MSNAPTWEPACEYLPDRRHDASALLSAAAVPALGPTARWGG